MEHAVFIAVECLLGSGEGIKSLLLLFFRKEDLPASLA
jgi:hypothetical protein